MPNRLAISSMSLGRCYAGHAIEHKLDMAQKYGYEGIELFYEDLADLATRMASPQASDHSPPQTEQQHRQGNELAAAAHIRDLCAARGLAIISLQPFCNYDGLRDRAEHNRRIRELRHWIDIAHTVGTDLIQIPSNMLPSEYVIQGDIDILISDLRVAADIGLAANPVVRFAYESLAWSSTSDIWETSWEVVRRADRPNLGLCLDTFNIAARVYADPAHPSGRNPSADEEIRLSMARLMQSVEPSKIYFLQVVDAERLSSPLVEGHRFHVDGQPPRMSWSRNCRLFYGEERYGAYLPVRQIAAAIFKGLGYEGWISLELFNRRMADEGSEVPEELARRGAASWRKLVLDLDLPVSDESRPVPIEISSL